MTDLADRSQTQTEDLRSIETVIIGGGQSGLSVGYYLAKAGRQFVILDAGERTGDAWRNRWDSLLLFTPARFNALPGMSFPARRDEFVSKDAMADYLEAYQQRFQLPVRHGVKVDGLRRQGSRFVVSAGELEIVADNVVVAMANYQTPRIPGFAKALDPRIVQIHSSSYKNPSQLQEGSVLVVGAGNSGADIGMEVAKTHTTWMAGKESAAVPFRIEPFIARHFLISIVRFLGHHVLTVRTPIGRKVRPKFLVSAAPLVRVKPKDLVASGIQRVSRVVGVQDGQPVVGDGEVLDVANVIWCTGFRPGFSWIDLPIFGDGQEPQHERGIVASQPGLYFVGLHFLYAATSDTVTGVQRDAHRVAKHLLGRTANRPSTTLTSTIASL
ncbi:MAG: NAD(P)/FAD-dependent oxidoreductase [Actinomycetota bacterium]|nr:NAD(P)/FAD-dependent oxidoreductase [Actinomycetota bacterium]